MDAVITRTLINECAALAERRAQLAADIVAARAQAAATGLPCNVLSAVIRGNLADALLLALSWHPPAAAPMVAKPAELRPPHRTARKAKPKPAKKPTTAAHKAAPPAPAPEPLPIAPSPAAPPPAANGHAVEPSVAIGDVVTWPDDEHHRIGRVLAFRDGGIVEIEEDGPEAPNIARGRIEGASGLVPANGRRWRQPVDAVKVIRPEVAPEPPAAEPPARPRRGTTRAVVDQVIEAHRAELSAMPRTARDQWLANHAVAGIVLRRTALRQAGL